jgi:hypothetical protein
LKHVTVYNSPLAFYKREAVSSDATSFILEVPVKERDLVGKFPFLETQAIDFRPSGTPYPS